MSAWEKDYGKTIKGVRRELMDHHITERQSRSFDFRTPSMGSMYAFSLTWTPGSMFLAGDLGEMQLTHYHAMGETAVKSFDWVASSHPDYLLGKSDAKKVYDRDATWETIKYDLDEEIRSLAKHYREECQEVRIDCTHKHEWAFRSPDIRDFEDGFRAMQSLIDEFTWSSGKDDVFSSAGRRRIRAEVREYIMDHSHDEVARALSNSGYDDYYGSMKWDHSAISQITAMQYGAKMAHKILCQEYDLLQAQRIADASRKWYAAGHPVEGPIWNEFAAAMGEKANQPA